MKSFVIYVDISDKSTESAKYTRRRFINHLNIDIELFKGINTENVWQTLIDSKYNILDIKRFGAGKIDAEIATFFSHYNLWLKCIELNEPILILEHDAIINNEIDLDILKNFKGDLLNLGKPNWGSWFYGKRESEWLKKESGITKRQICKNKHDIYAVWNDGYCHCDTMWLFGAHSYLINPSGARKLIKEVEKGILPADVYIRTTLLDVYDYLPHPISQNPEFTLIQRWQNSNNF